MRYSLKVFKPTTYLVILSVTLDSETYSYIAVFLHAVVTGRVCYCQNITFKTNLLNTHYHFIVTILHRFQSVNFCVIRSFF